MQVSYYLKILNCEFVSVSLSSELSRGITINSSVFGNGFCPILILDLINSAVIANNTFENCQHNSVIENAVQVHIHTSYSSAKHSEVVFSSAFSLELNTLDTNEQEQ